MPVDPALVEFQAGYSKLLHRPLVQFHQQLSNGSVQVGQTEERAIPDPGQDPPLCDQDGRFNFRFVPSFPRPGRYDNGAVVFGLSW